MNTAGLLNGGTLVQLSAAISKERDLVLQDESPAVAATAVHKLTSISSVSLAMAGHAPLLASKLRMAALELHAAEEALRRDQTALAAHALGNALTWLHAARAETGEAAGNDASAGTG